MIILSFFCLFVCFALEICWSGDSLHTDTCTGQLPETTYLDSIVFKMCKSVENCILKFLTQHNIFIICAGQEMKVKIRCFIIMYPEFKIYDSTISKNLTNFVFEVISLNYLLPCITWKNISSCS